MVALCFYGSFVDTMLLALNWLQDFILW